MVVKRRSQCEHRHLIPQSLIFVQVRASLGNIFNLGASKWTMEPGLRAQNINKKMLKVVWILYRYFYIQFLGCYHLFRRLRFNCGTGPRLDASRISRVTYHTQKGLLMASESGICWTWALSYRSQKYSQKTIPYWYMDRLKVFDAYWKIIASVYNYSENVFSRNVAGTVNSFIGELRVAFLSVTPEAILKGDDCPLWVDIITDFHYHSCYS